MGILIRQENKDNLQNWLLEIKERWTVFDYKILLELIDKLVSYQINFGVEINGDAIADEYIIQISHSKNFKQDFDKFKDCLETILAYKKKLVI